jgi:hypothetical protein
VSGAHEAARWIPLFPEEEIPFILAAVLRCSATLRKKHSTEHENRISARLRKLLVRDARLRQRPIHLDPEAYVYDEDADDENPMGRLDFRFLFSTGTRKPWPYFAIEAKRLHVAFPSGWQSVVSEYVTGKQGMMCFIDQRYAQGLASGGMLAYVFDGDTEKARASVGIAIKANHEKLKCRKPFTRTASAVLPEDSRVTETIHGLTHGDLVIYHLFIPV